MTYRQLAPIPGLVIAALAFSSQFPAQAQNTIQPDATLVNAASRITPDELIRGDLADLIEGGVIRGGNLFHSFLEFNVADGQRVYFANPDGIDSIFSRVTGGDPSNIFGTLGVDGAADLFLLNPNGIVFGENAALDVGGSFTATTASGVQFSDEGRFSTIAPETPAASLTINPSALFFDQLENAPITNQAQSPADLDPSGTFETFGLRVPDGESLLLVGGNVDIVGGWLAAIGGRVDIGGLREPGSVDLNRVEGQVQLSFPANSQKANVSLSDDARITVRGDGGGDVAINASNLNIFSDSEIYAGIGPGLGNQETRAGDINLLVEDDINLREGSLIYNYIDRDARGIGGNVIINTSQLTLTEGSQLGALVFGNGSAGNVQISATGEVTLDGRSSATDPRSFPSGIFNNLEAGEGSSGDIAIQAENLTISNRAQIASVTRGLGPSGNILLNVGDRTFLENSIIISEVVEGSGIGDGGDITIDTRTLELVNGSALLADTENIGDAGNIVIRASERVALLGQGPGALNPDTPVPSQITTTVEGENTRGEGGDIYIVTRFLDINDESLIRSLTEGQGTAGDIKIQSDFLNLADGSEINASTNGPENAGVILISVNDTILASGRSENGFRSEIISTSSENATGDGGAIFITGSNLFLTDGARISAESEGSGLAGNINFILENLEVFDSTIETNATQSQGGDINVNVTSNAPTGKLTLRGDGDITTDSFGNGGNITLNSLVIAFDDSDILARSTDARGGDITLGPFFSDTIPIGSESPTQDNDRVDISADGRLASGVITTPDVTFVENNLNDLTANIIVTDQLLAGSCIARADNDQGSFVITGSGGLPAQPGDLVMSTYATGEVQPLDSSEPQAVWQPGDPMVEPTGAYPLADGRLVLSRECD
jgi:filamentous hemagglutinin family protein